MVQGSNRAAPTAVRPAMADDLSAFLACCRRFRRALSVEDYAAMDRVIAAAERRGPPLVRVIDDPLAAALVAVLVGVAKEGEGGGDPSHERVVDASGGREAGHESRDRFRRVHESGMVFRSRVNPRLNER